MLRSLGRVDADVVHLQWLAAPELDAHLRLRSPSVFTAHDLLPRRTAVEARSLAAVAASIRPSGRSQHARPARRCGELGVDATVIPHPVYPSSAQRADDGHTLLSLGVLRPYKGLADAIEVTRRLPETRLLVAGDPAMPLDGLRAAERVEWRLGYLTPGELDRALGETTVAVFPVPRRARPVGCAAAGTRGGRAGGRLRRRRARRADSTPSVPAASCRRVTSTALAEAVRELLESPTELEAARAGAERARAALTWDAAAAQHLELYETLS